MGRLTCLAILSIIVYSFLIHNSRTLFEHTIELLFEFLLRIEWLSAQFSLDAVVCIKVCWRFSCSGQGQETLSLFCFISFAPSFVRGPLVRVLGQLFTCCFALCWFINRRICTLWCLRLCYGLLFCWLEAGTSDVAMKL